MDYEIVIGLEVHAQLLTRSKMFCSCSAGYQEADPNTVVCPVCLGMPGVLPVINRRAVELVVRTGLALECQISGRTKFDRKNYPYPDLMKGYQISQYDMPIAHDGCLEIDVDGHARPVGITRVHLEEDVAKLMHRSEPFGEGYSLLDVNRAGVPLMEVVSEPDMRSAEEARAYLTRLHSILRYIGVSSANMEEGSFRCDANISIRPVGDTELGPKVEVKNMNSFRSVFSALQFEAERQKAVLEEGGRIEQETRGWNDERAETLSQRSKEYASDYRYFPEPDLPPLEIDPAWVDQVRERLPELPHQRERRFVAQYGLSAYDAGLLTSTREMADYFEAALGSPPAADLAKPVANWILGELLRLMNLSGESLQDVKVRPAQIAELVALVDSGVLSSTMAKDVFEQMYSTGDSPEKIAQESGAIQISDSDAIAGAVAEAISANPKPVEDYLEGKEAVMRFLVGQVMRITKGKANPQLASEELVRRLDALKRERV